MLSPRTNTKSSVLNAPALWGPQHSGKYKHKPVMTLSIGEVMLVAIANQMPPNLFLMQQLFISGSCNNMIQAFRMSWQLSAKGWLKDLNTLHLMASASSTFGYQSYTENTNCQYQERKKDYHHRSYKHQTDNKWTLWKTLCRWILQFDKMNKFLKKMYLTNTGAKWSKIFE